MHLLPEVDLQGVSWHPNKHIIAFISAPTQVLVRDYQESGTCYDHETCYWQLTLRPVWINLINKALIEDRK